MSLSRQPSPSPEPSLTGELGRSLTRFLHPVALLALMWVVRAADFVLPGTFNTYGIRAWDITSLFGLATSPVLHSGWGHLLANTVPFLILGLLVAADGARRFWVVTAIIAAVGGIGTWVVNFPGTVTVGASGLVFGYFGYLAGRAVFVKSMAHRIGYAVVAVFVVLTFGGSMLIGVLPLYPGISWQGHLFGAVGGAIAAWLLARGDNRRALEARQARVHRDDPYGLRDLGL
ncbi:rhomboid family intramembrane serine protease [Brevibacterium daeguense]|uniref:Rhomboid family intramembrane serine protease n=1 Tax=Brevibacterium daeguense TaxID=909936 RepID=A0ABP8EM66_9MICO|nr:rhomboid family intramembrane serine protease [Brevibacterium daeguense]